MTTVVGLLADGYTTSEVLADYPTLTKEDVLAALAYAARAVDERELLLRLAG